MLKVRVIPTLLWKGPGLVKGVGFDSWRRVGPVLPAIRVYNRREVDELVLLDILGHSQGHKIDYESIQDYGGDCFVPMTVGGGITSVHQVERLLRSGADKVSINSHTYRKPEFVTEIADRFGSQCVVASLDVKKIVDGRWTCYSASGAVPEHLDAIAWAIRLQELGAGELLVTSIDRDGTMSGYDLPLVAAIAEAVNIPVIASGGAGSYQDMVDAVVEAGASAVAAASIFHFTEMTPAGAKEAMSRAGIPVRTPYLVPG